jgi:hypothetical protein
MTRIQYSSVCDVQIPSFHFISVSTVFSRLDKSSTLSDDNKKAGVKWQRSSLKTGRIDTFEPDELNQPIST